MAARYWVGATASWDATAGTKWSLTSGGAGGQAVPTAADDVFFDAASGAATVTLAAAGVVRSVTCTGFTGTFVITNQTLTIGDASGGALTLAAGMTLTGGGTAAISMQSSSTNGGTGWGFTTAGLTVAASVTFGSASNLGKWVLQDTFTCTGTVFLVGGTLDTNSKTCTWSLFSTDTGTRTLSLGASQITITGGASSGWTVNTPATLTLNAGTSTIIFTGTDARLTNGAKTYYDVTFNGPGSASLFGSTGSTYHNLTRTGTAAVTDSFTISNGTTQTVTGTLTVNGNSTKNRMLIITNSLGVAATINAAAVSTSYTDWTDITAAGAANWNLSASTGGSGDALGNTGITFTPAQTQTWSGTSGGNWSANAWTTRIPLPQDNVVINAAFVAGQTVTNDMPRMGRDINFTGSAPVSYANSLNTIFYGSWTFSTNVSTPGGPGVQWTFGGRGSHTIDWAGRSYPSGTLIINATASGTYTLQSNFVLSNTGATLRNTSGTFDANGFNVTASVFTFTAAAANVKMGSGTWTATFNGTPWGYTAGTITPGTSTIAITDTTATAKTLNFGGKTYNNLTISGGGTGAVNITGANTFNTVTVSGPKTVTFAASTTNTVSTLNLVGTAANLVTFQSATAATQFTVTGIASANAQYVAVKDSNVQGAATPIGDVNGTNNGNNSGWFMAFQPALVDPLGMSDIAQRTMTVQRASVDALGPSDNMARARTRQVGSTLVAVGFRSEAGDTFVMETGSNRPVLENPAPSEGLGLADTMARARTRLVGSSGGGFLDTETGGTFLLETGSFRLILESLVPSDFLGLSDSCIGDRIAQQQVQETLGLLDGMLRARTRIVGGSFSVLDTESGDPLVDESGSRLTTEPAGDTLGVTDLYAAPATAHYDDLLGLADSEITTRIRELTETIGLLDAAAAAPILGLIDTLGLLDTVDPASTRTLTDLVGILDTYLGEGAGSYEIQDLLGLIDSFATPAARQLDDLLGLDDTTITDRERRLDEELGIGDPPSLARSVQLTDEVDLFDTYQVAGAGTYQVNDLLGLLDEGIFARIRELQDSIDLLDARAALPVYQVDDPLGVLDTLVADRGQQFSDPLGLTDRLQRDWIRQLVDPLGLLDASTVAQDFDRVLGDILGLTDPYRLFSSRDLLDGLDQSDQFLLARLVEATDPVGLVDSYLRDQTRTMLDLITLIDSTTRDYDRSLGETLGLVDLVACAYARTVVDNLDLVDEARFPRFLVMVATAIHLAARPMLPVAPTGIAASPTLVTLSPQPVVIAAPALLTVPHELIGVAPVALTIQARYLNHLAPVDLGIRVRPASQFAPGRVQATEIDLSILPMPIRRFLYGTLRHGPFTLAIQVADRLVRVSVNERTIHTTIEEATITGDTRDRNIRTTIEEETVTPEIEEAIGLLYKDKS